ncbi:site-specific integrase [Nocardiopsis sp. CNR-923]|uniref:site-specific integrase n=1 Tax=Nocardiopsis sp. CNR-923 TaxID=1904965 RepID=UPI0021CC56A5|nr:site-specific integrase [Nocardiopsis sp. CNR-923]
MPYQVHDSDDQPIEPIRRYLRDFVAQGRSAGSVRSYAYDLLRWWRWLQVVDVEWDKVTSAEVREFVLWLQRSTKSRRTPRTSSASTVGTINPITRKQYPGDQYAVRTIRHSNAVIRSFYEFWIARGDGPLVNPVPQERRVGSDRTRTTTRWSRSCRKGGCATTPRFPSGAPARCPISSGTPCSRPCVRTVTGP